MKKIISALALATATLCSSAMAAPLPDTPVAFKSGTGALVDGVIYLGLGTAGQNWYKLDTKAKDPKWVEIASFIGTPRDQAQSVVLDNKIYVFGGAGKATFEATRIGALNDVYCYDIKKNSWQKVMTRSPFGLTGHAATTVDHKTAIIVGSVNKAIFDGYFEDIETAQGNKAILDLINATYTGKKCEDYFFNREVLAYNPQTNDWASLGQMPTLGTAGSALAVDGNSVTVINGERKPGLRTAKVSKFTVNNNILEWSALQDLVPPTGADVQEGVAGAFAGVSGHMVLVAGGANFPGSTVAYAKGKNFAHQGLTKTWRDEVYAYDGSNWSNVGKLPLPLGYGLALQDGDKIVLVGGETVGGKPTSQVMTMSFENGKLVIEK